jgi:hypothetical protein
MHLVITLIIDQSWIKARKDTKEATCSRAIVSSSNLKKTKFTKCRQARPTGFGVLRRPPPYRCYPVDGLRLGLRVLIRLIFITTDERAETDTLSESWLAFHWHKSP